MADALLIGLSALDAQRRAMEVTAHNIANASTEGYSRQRVSLVTPVPEEGRPGTIGRGVEINSIMRQVDTLLNERLRASSSQIGYYDTLASTLTDLELIYNEPGDGGFSAVIDATFAALQDLSNNPESVALRTGVVQQLETFTGTLRLMRDRLGAMRDDLKLQMDAEIIQANRISEEIADLNQDIKRLVLVGQNPNDLLDHRDRLVRELSEHMDVRVFIEPRDQTARIELRGSTLVSASQAFTLQRGTDSFGNDTVLFASGTRAHPGGGSLGALEELSATILPEAITGLDNLAGTVIRSFNAVHATGISHTYSQNLHSSVARLDTSGLTLDMDDPSLIRQANSEVGFYDGFAPVFTSPGGDQLARNLTINVYDEVNAVANKFVVRYEPGTGVTPAGRSMADLIEAINTGAGGGFSVYPPMSGGVIGVQAQAVPVSGGVGFQLSADEGVSVDFSSALDLRPASSAWTGDGITVVGTDASLADSSLSFEVQNGGTELAVYRHDPLTGNRIAYAGSPISIPAGGGPVTVGGGLVDVTFDPGGVYRDGESFAAAVDGAGAINHGEAATWTHGNAGFRISGRYTGEQTFTPAQTWGMQVLSDGVVGSADTPPVVEFSYWTGPAGAGVLQTVQVTLDESIRPGDQVRIADGVYAVFDAGALTVGDQADFIVDSEPDQAGLLVGLGINTLFAGNNAATIAVADRLRSDPGALAVSSTRSAGDNSNLLDLIAVRQAKRYGPSGAGLDEYYQGQVAQVAVRTQQNRAVKENQTLVQRSLENRRDAVSGVSIDEEVGLMISQQQAYSAAARVISMARENIDTLMRIMGA